MINTRLFAACVLACGSAAATPTWIGDFSDGTLHKYGVVHCGGTPGEVCPCDGAGMWKCGSDGNGACSAFTSGACSTADTDMSAASSDWRFQIVTPPAMTSGTALRMQTQGQDRWSSLDRNDLLHVKEANLPSPEYDYQEGDERYFSVDMYFPSGGGYGSFPPPPAYVTGRSDSAWHTLFQFHQVGNCGTVPLTISLNRQQDQSGGYTGNEYQIDFTTLATTSYPTTSGLQPWRTALERDQWLHFVVHVKFSTDPQIGFVELWYNGNRVVPKTLQSTLFTMPANWPSTGCDENYAPNPSNRRDMPVYFGIDLYRSLQVTATETMYFKNLVATQDACDVGVDCVCASGLTSCGGQCVDTTGDPSNCGGCGTVCAAGQTCSAGVCTGGGGGATRLTGTDVNGDRKGDLLARDAAGNFFVFISNGTILANAASFTSWYTDADGWSSGNRFYAMDIDGDGKTDLLARGANGTFEVSLSNGTTVPFHHGFTSGFSDAAGWNGGNQFFVGDIDGDGKDDLFARQAGGDVQLLISDGTKLVSRATVATPYTYAAGWASGNRFYPLDLNGDGKCDLLARNPDGTFDVWISSGRNLTRTGSFSTPYSDAAGWATGLRFFVLDINGDGKGDLLARGANGTFEVLLSNGNVLTTNNPSFATYFTDAAGWNAGNRFLVLDVDGDGRTDMMMRGANGVVETWLSNGSVLTNGHPSTITNLTDANGWNGGLRFF